jgi:DNA integrity scanning protein DisA with diadenylate cyclase activity
MSEHSDALTIIVSEQNGKISYTQNGKIKIGVSEKQLTNYLNKQFNSKKES